MPDLRQLHELAAQVRTPELADLADVADRRRRRAAAALGGAAAAILVVIVVVTASVSGERGAARIPVAPGPSTPAATITTPLPDPSTSYPALSAEAIRRHPTAALDSDLQIATTAASAGVAARVWTACMSDCNRATEYVPGEVQQALEVTRDGFATSSLYAIGWGGNVSHAVDDWFYFESSRDPVLVNSRGQERPLEFGPEVGVMGVSGPLVYSSQGVAFIDLSDGTVHALQRQGRDQTWEWQGAGDTWFWGTVVLVDNGTVIRHAVLWRNADGTFAAKVLLIPASEGGPGMLVSRRAGTMAVAEHFASPRLAHISTDYGATWQVRQVPDGEPSAGSLPPHWTTWPQG